MTERNTSILNQVSENRSEYVGFCRFLSNPRISPDKLIEGTVAMTKKLVTGKDLLVINDTSELNYEHHKGYFKDGDPDLGPTGNNKDIGFFLHPGYVIDRHTGVGMGFGYIKIWNRQFGKKDKHQRNYNRLPITEKESYRWIECADESKLHLNKANHITIVADRESDIYDEFATVPDEKVDLLIRSCQDRSLYGEKEMLYDKISKEPCKGTFMLHVKKAQKRSPRLVTIEVRYARLKIKRPSSCVNKILDEYVEVNVIEAKEQPHSVPKDETPILWRLLTTLPVNSSEQAIGAIEDYRQRWDIELLFATMKSKGLNVELSQLETGKSLKSLCVLALVSALRIMQLRQCRKNGNQINANISFKPQEIELMKILIGKYEGKTIKQKNPYQQYSLAWASWLIARIGGWKGYACESPPGFKTFTIGLSRFDRIYEGYQVSKRCVHS